MHDVLKNTYLMIQLDVTGFDKDLLTGVLTGFPLNGIEEISPQLWNIYFTGNVPPDLFRMLLQSLRRLDPAFTEQRWVISRLENRDWNSEWKKHFQPFRAGERVWITPPWETPVCRDGEEMVIIDPQMAFGTGHHATTRMMIRAVERFVTTGKTVLDAGTGSGILAILSGKMGARQVIAFDVDPLAIENARHNAHLNHTSGINFMVGDLPQIPRQTFDVILANIQGNVLREMMPGLGDRLKGRGWMILSGLLESDLDTLTPLILSPLKLRERWQEEEWITVGIQKIK